MKILFCGDVVGKAGRDCINTHIPKLRQQLFIDMVIVNGENAAHGFGITPSICQDMWNHGVDVITLGNHSWDKREVLPLLGSSKKIVRPINYPSQNPGKGYTIFPTPKGDVLVVNVLGQLFMESVDNGFHIVANLLKQYPLGSMVKAIVIDIHAEACSEKMAMGFFLDGRVSLVVGSHTHVPTADAQILPKGTAYQTDAGMCGDYCSVIGMDPVVPIDRFLKNIHTQTSKLEPSGNVGCLCGVLVTLDTQTGLAKAIEPVRIGNRLHNTHQL